MKGVVADQQVRRGSAATIRVGLLDQDGDLSDPSGTVTVGVRSGAGAVVVTAGQATTIPDGSVGTREAPLTAPQTAALDWLTATWTDAGDGSVTTTLVEVVSGYYASVQQIRSADLVLDDPEQYPSWKIIAARRAVETEFEDITDTAFVPRYARERLSGTGTRELVLSMRMLRTVRSVRVYSDATTYTSFTAGECASIPLSDAGIATRTDGGIWPAGIDNIEVEYEHGYDRPPHDILEAFTTRIRDVLNRKNRGIPDRTTTFTSPSGGTYTVATPGRQEGQHTGIGDVDEVLTRYAKKTIGFA